MAQKETDNTQKVVDNVFSSIQSRLEEALCEEDDTNVRIRVQAVLESMPEKILVPLPGQNCITILAE